MNLLDAAHNLQRCTDLMSPASSGLGWLPSLGLNTRAIMYYNIGIVKCAVSCLSTFIPYTGSRSWQAGHTLIGGRAGWTYQTQHRMLSPFNTRENNLFRGYGGCCVVSIGDDKLEVGRIELAVGVEKGQWHVGPGAIWHGQGWGAEWTSENDR